MILLQQEIELAAEKEKQEREKIQKGEESSPGASNLGIIASATGAGEEGSTSPSAIGGNGENGAEKMNEPDTQGDIKMES